MVIRRPAFLLLILVLVLAFVRIYFFDEYNGDLLYCEGDIKEISGEVISVSYKDESASIILKCKNEKVLIKVDKLDESYKLKLYNLCGRTLYVRGEISIPSTANNPGCFDYNLYLKGKNIYTICTCNRFKLSSGQIVNIFLNIISVCKSKFYIEASKYLTDDAKGLLFGVLFGDSSQIEDESYSMYQSLGIAHILAVSGLHINLIYDLCLKLLGKRKDKLSSLVCIALTFTYCAMSNFSVSSLRAFFMLLLKLCAFHLDRRYDSVSAACIAASILIISNPYRIFNSGMQISFLAAYSMGIAYPWISTKLAKLSDKMRSEAFYKISTVASPVLAASLGTGPICIYYFYQYSWISIFLNPVVIALTGVLLPLGLLTFAIFLLLPQSLVSIPLYLACKLVELPAWAISFITNLGKLICPNSYIASPPLALLILYYSFFFFIFSENRYILHRQKKYKALSIYIISIFISCITLPFSFGIGKLNPFAYESAKITFLDVGQGDCIHIRLGNFNMLIDGGGNYYSNIAKNTLLPYLLRNGVSKIDLAIITHEDQDHAKGIYELSELMPIKKIITASSLYGEPIEDPNNECIVMSFEIDGISFLFMGDAGFERENYLKSLSNFKGFDVIKIAHHGSKNSTGEDFILRVNPSFAVISVGKNNYGHPSERVIENLDDFGIIYGRTDEYGAIYLSASNGSSYTFKATKKDKTWLIQKRKQLNIHQEQ